MAQTDSSITGLIGGLIHDTRVLIREQIALARAELREQVNYGRTVGIAFGSAAVAGLIGATLLCIGLANALAYFLSWPAWAGYAIVAVLLLGGAVALGVYGRNQLKNVRGLPKTTETLRENLAWIQGRAGGK